MSVTFHPEIDSTVPYILECICRGWKSPAYPNRSAAYQASRAISKGDCGGYYCGDSIYAHPEVFEPEVQLSNVNADELLDYLQISVGGNFEDRCTGSLSADDMLERVSWALEIAPTNSGLTTMTVGNITYCGRPSDYIQSKLTRLREVAEWAKVNSRDVVWG
jgi:hypothetical protein